MPESDDMHRTALGFGRVEEFIVLVLGFIILLFVLPVSYSSHIGVGRLAHGVGLFHYIFILIHAHTSLFITLHYLVQSLSAKRPKMFKSHRLVHLPIKSKHCKTKSSSHIILIPACRRHPSYISIARMR